jgi:hypothetical protein
MAQNNKSTSNGQLKRSQAVSTEAMAQYKKRTSDGQ